MSGDLESVGELFYNAISPTEYRIEFFFLENLIESVIVAKQLGIDKVHAIYGLRQLGLSEFKIAL